jgi:hypothetical protein
MATRKVHNRIAAKFVNLPMQEIDEVNRMVDDPRMLKKYGKNHRKYWGHNPDPTARDSMIISRGDPRRELVRKIHIIVDTDDKIKRSLELMEIRERIKKLKKVR